MSETLFTSDLHLSREYPATLALFYKFIRRRAVGADALYILGDLFDAWVGDDDLDPPNDTVAARLRELVDNGVPVYFMHGNRDFLVGENFAAASGCTLLSDPTVVELYGAPTLLAHGDTLCTGDHAYQQFRASCRKPAWRQEFLSRSLDERRALAARYRLASREHQSEQPEEIMDVNRQAVQDAMRAHGVYRLIHGHTHRPAVHQLTLNGRAAERIVLADWGSKGSVLCVDDQGYRVESV